MSHVTDASCMCVCAMQKRIEVLGVEVGYYHAHIKGVDWVRRPWQLMIICLHLACLGQASKSSSNVPLMHWCARLPQLPFHGELLTCGCVCYHHLHLLCRYLWTIHHISGWAVSMLTPLACMATTRHGAACCILALLALMCSILRTYAADSAAQGGEMLTARRGSACARPQRLVLCCSSVFITFMATLLESSSMQCRANSGCPPAVPVCAAVAGGAGGAAAGGAERQPVRPGLCIHCQRLARLPRASLPGWCA